MKTKDTFTNTFENLSTPARVTRFAVSVIAIVTAMNSPLVGSSLFALVTIFAVALATTAIIGSDPGRALVQALSRKYADHVPYRKDHFRQGHHA